MISHDNVTKNSDSLMELLAAQCADLEKLLLLAREETLAAEQGKFSKIWDIVSERAAIGARLETYQHQIGELRTRLESSGVSVNQYDITSRVIEFASLTLAQDQKTRLLLTDSREEALTGLKNLEKSNRGANAYLHEERKGLAYSRNF